MFLDNCLSLGGMKQKQIKDSEVFLNDYFFCHARLRMKELRGFEEWVTPLICNDEYLYGHKTLQCLEFTNEYASSIHLSVKSCLQVGKLLSMVTILKCNLKTILKRNQSHSKRNVSVFPNLNLLVHSKDQIENIRFNFWSKYQQPHQ